MVFYAYTVPSQNENTWRYLITAPSVEVVDQWFRLSREGGLELERKSPDFYVYPWIGGVYPWQMVNDKSKTASKLKLQIFFTRFNDEGGIYQMMFANQFAPDHTSGNAFWVRSKSKPDVFWTIDEKKVKASRYSRTKFQISNPSKPDQVMLPDDSITISAVDAARGEIAFVQGQVGQPLTLNNYNQSGGAWGQIARGHFTFSDFKKKFLSHARVEDPASDAEVILVPGSPQFGEEWELVL